MSSTPASLAELLDRAGDREDQRLLDEGAASAAIEVANNWHRGDDDVLPPGRGRHQRRFNLRLHFGN